MIRRRSKPADADPGRNEETAFEGSAPESGAAKRKHFGALMVDFEVDPGDIDDLRAIGLLSSADRESHPAIADGDTSGAG
jgi:hypothetical protein